MDYGQRLAGPPASAQNAAAGRRPSGIAQRQSRPSQLSAHAVPARAKQPNTARAADAPQRSAARPLTPGQIRDRCASGQKTEKSAILTCPRRLCINLSWGFAARISPVEVSHRQNPGCIADFSNFCPPRQDASEKLSISLLFVAKRMHLTACFMHFKTGSLDHLQGGPIELASLPHPTRILQHAHAWRRTTNRCNT